MFAPISGDRYSKPCELLKNLLNVKKRKGRTKINYPKNRYRGEKPWMNKDWLYQEYVIKDRSSKEIAEEYGCKQNTIQQWLLKHGIKKEIKTHNIKYTKPYQNQNHLYEQHIINKKSLSQIAKENNVSVDTISYFCKKFNIKTWRQYSSSKLTEEQWNEIEQLYKSGVSTYQLEKIYGMSHGNIKRGLIKRKVQIRSYSEAQFTANGKNMDERFNNKDWLEFQHWSLNKSCKEIGEELGVDAGTVRRHMNSLGIPTKNNSQSKIGVMIGENHPNWKGGVTPLNLLLREYFTTNLAPIAAKRDKYTCQKCGKQHTVLNAHHIKHFSDIVQEILKEYSDLSPNKTEDKMKLYQIITHDQRFLDIDNLITLCKDCHIKLHSKDN